MSSSNTPCYNTALCGVKSHRPGTHAKCFRGSAAADAATARAKVAVPKLASTSNVRMDSGAILSESEREAVAEELLKNPAMVEMGRILNKPHSEQVTGQQWRKLMGELENMGMEYSHVDAMEVERLIINGAKKDAPWTSARKQPVEEVNPVSELTPFDPANPLASGTADPDAKWDDEKASSAGYEFASADVTQEEWFQKLTPEQKKEFGLLRSEAKDKLKLHFVADVQWGRQEDEPEQYMVHEDGRYMLGSVGSKSIGLTLWDDFGDGKSVETEGGRDAYLETVGKRFDELYKTWDEG